MTREPDHPQAGRERAQQHGERAPRGPEGDTVTVTMPDEDNAGSDRNAQPLGSEVAPPADPDSQGGEAGPAGGVAGPSFPPAETEPDVN